MSLKEKTSQITDLMKKTKEDWVATGPENPDLAIYLHFWRGDELIVVVQTRLDRDTGLEAGLVGAAGFGATTMSLTFESYTSTLKISPNTGKPWVPHEMQYTFEAVPENRVQHWVTECLSTSVHERGGDFVFSSLPYVREGNSVIWGEEVINFTPNEGEVQGRMFGYLQDAMSRPTIQDVISQNNKADKVIATLAALVDDEELRAFHLDMATLRALKERELVTSVIFPVQPGTDRAKWIEERLGAENIVISD